MLPENICSSKFFIRLCVYAYEILVIPFFSTLVLYTLVVGVICLCSSLQLYCELLFILSPFSSFSTTWLSLQGTEKFCCKARQLSTAHLLWPRWRNSCMLRFFFQVQLAGQLFRWVIIHRSDLICRVFFVCQNRWVTSSTCLLVSDAGFNVLFLGHL